MSNPKITDSHTHLDFPDFDDARDAIVARAVEAGVHRMVTICTKLKNEPGVRALAETYDPVFYAAGTHPMSAADEPLATADALVALADAYDVLTAMLIVGAGDLVLAILLLFFARRPRVAVPPPTPAMNIAALLEAFLAGRAAGGAAGASGSGTSQAGTQRDDD